MSEQHSSLALFAFQPCAVISYGYDFCCMASAAIGCWLCSEDGQVVCHREVIHDAPQVLSRRQLSSSEVLAGWGHRNVTR